MPHADPPLTVDPPVLRTAGAADREPLVSLLVDALFADAVARWIFPDPAGRRDLLPGFFRAFYDLSLEQGEIVTTEALDGVALTLAPGAEVGPDFDARLATAAAEHGEALAGVVRAQHAHQPTTPHRYVTFGAVAPHRQRTGLGSVMLAEIVRRCDETATPAYLEASSDGGYATACRHGFEPTGSEIRIAPGVTLRPMWRDLAR